MAMVDISSIQSSSSVMMEDHHHTTATAASSILSHASILSLEEFFDEPPPLTEFSRRRVGFCETVEFIASASPLDLLEEETSAAAPFCSSQEESRNCLWYEARDLEDFRTEARDLCRQMRSEMMMVVQQQQQQQQQQESNNNNTGDDNDYSLHQQQNVHVGGGVSLARDNQTRGLEQRSCLERQRRRYLANKCIVRAQYKLTPDRLSALACKCTQWAAELATEEAARDFVRAYVNMDDDVDDIDEVNNDDVDAPRMVEPSCNNNNKRHAVACQDEQQQHNDESSRRVVRARLSY
jgi:hypothetical protein